MGEEGASTYLTLTHGGLFDNSAVGDDSLRVVCREDTGEDGDGGGGYADDVDVVVVVMAAAIVVISEV